MVRVQLIRWVAFGLRLPTWNLGRRTLNLPTGVAAFAGCSRGCQVRFTGTPHRAEYEGRTGGASEPALGLRRAGRGVAAVGSGHTGVVSRLRVGSVSCGCCPVWWRMPQQLVQPDATVLGPTSSPLQFYDVTLVVVPGEDHSSRALHCTLASFTKQPSATLRTLKGRNSSPCRTAPRGHARIPSESPGTVPAGLPLSCAFWVLAMLATTS